MVIDRKVALTGSMNWTANTARNSEDLSLLASPIAAAAYTAHWRNRLVASVPFRPARGLLPQARGGRPQIGITAKMKPEQDERLEGGGVHSQPGTAPLNGYGHRRSSAKSRIRYSKPCVVPGGALSIESAVSLC
jgi:hypothetical protein